MILELVIGKIILFIMDFRFSNFQIILLLFLSNFIYLSLYLIFRFHFQHLIFHPNILYYRFNLSKFLDYFVFKIHLNYRLYCFLFVNYFNCIIFFLFIILLIITNLKISLFANNAIMIKFFIQNCSNF